MSKSPIEAFIFASKTCYFFLEHHSEDLTGFTHSTLCVSYINIYFICKNDCPAAAEGHTCTHENLAPPTRLTDEAALLLPQMHLSWPRQRPSPPTTHQHPHHCSALSSVDSFEPGISVLTVMLAGDLQCLSLFS